MNHVWNNSPFHPLFPSMFDTAFVMCEQPWTMSLIDQYMEIHTEQKALNMIF